MKKNRLYNKTYVAGLVAGVTTPLGTLAAYDGSEIILAGRYGDAVPSIAIAIGLFSVGYLVSEVLWRQGSGDNLDETLVPKQ